jgi:hypothetical protein
MEELIDILVNLLTTIFQDRRPRPKQAFSPAIRPVPGSQPPVSPLKKTAPRRVARRPAPPVIAMAAPIMTTVSRAAVPAVVPMARSIVANTGIAAPGSTPSQSAAAIRKWLQPDTLKHQFLLSEILQPPLALREDRHRL